MSQAVPHIFDSRRMTLRQERAAVRQTQASAARWLLDAMAEDVVERLGFLRFPARASLVTGLGAKAVAKALEGRVSLADSLPLETPLFGGPFDLVVTLGELDTINDLPGTLIHLRHALAPGGLLLATLVGAGSLPALRSALLAADGERSAARVHPQIDDRAASGLLERAGFSRQVVDRYALTARYGTLERLVADLRDQGLTSVLADRAPPLGKAALQRAQRAIASHADADGKTSERFEILTLTAWKD